MTGKSFTVLKVGDELSRAVELREALAGENPQLILDMIEGETEIHEAICVVYEETAEDERLVAGLKDGIEALQARKARLERSIETRRNIILMAMDKAGIDTIKSPLATITRRATVPKLRIIEEAEIPSAYFVRPAPEIDKKAIKAALDAGETVPGAQLDNGGITLTVRVR